MTRKHNLSVSTKDSQWTFPTESEYDVNYYPDDSKINEHIGTGKVVKSSPSKGGLKHDEAFHLDQHNTVLQG